MNDFDSSIDQEGPVPDDWREGLDSVDVPDMTPEQKERIDRKVRAAIAAQNRRFSWERWGKWALAAGLVAACGGGALVFALHEVTPHEHRSGLDAVDQPGVIDPQTLPPPSTSASAEPAGRGLVAPRRRRRHHP